MPGKRYSEHRRFLALRACWTILRGGSVAWKVNITDDGFETLAAPAFICGCQIEGDPVGLEGLWHGDPEAQPE